MAANKAVWGIDMGQCALKAIRLRVAGDSVEALDHVYIEHPKILSQPDADRSALLTEAMKKFTEQHDLTRETLVVGVPGQHTLARFTKLPPIAKKSKIPELVKYEAQQQIPFDMEEVIWDYQSFERVPTQPCSKCSKVVPASDTFNGTDPGGEPVEGLCTDCATEILGAAAVKKSRKTKKPEIPAETSVGIFAMRRELLRSHLHFLSSLNLEPAIVQSSPLALYNALQYDGLFGSEPVTILDIGAQNTDLIVVDGDSLWTRNIPIGGNNFTEALLKTFKLSFNKAENLKRTAATSKYARQIFQAMRPVFADLVAEVQRSIGFFTSNRRGLKLNKLVAMGNAFKLPGMLKFVQQNLSMEVVRPTAFKRLSTSQATRAPELMDQLLSFGVAYGLALQGLGRAQITSNLLPPEIAKQVIWRRKTPWFYGAAACLVLAATMVWGRNMADARVVTEATTGYSESVTDEARAAQIVNSGPNASLPPRYYAQQVVEAGQKLSSVLSEEQSQREAERRQRDDLTRLQTDKVVWPQILHLIHSALPEPDPELTEAMRSGGTAYKELVETGRFSRGDRECIFIQKLEAQYSPDVASAYLAAVGDRAHGGGRQTMDPTMGTPQHGFVITLEGQTPHKEGILYVNRTFLARLREAATDKMYFDGLRELDQGRLRDGVQGAGGTPRPRARGPIPRFGALGREELRDPVTGESMADDTTFKVVFKVVLGPRPTGVQDADIGGADVGGMDHLDFMQ